MGSGKGEVARFLRERNFEYISLSDMVRAEARLLGRPVNRQQMQDVGNRLRREGGSGVLGDRVREHILAHPEIRRWVIDGIRNPAEVTALRRMPFFLLLGLDAPFQTLLKRLLSRNRDTDRLSETELRHRLDREWGLGEPPDGQRVGDCMAMADTIIQNDNDLRELDRRVRIWIHEIEENHENH